MRVEKFEDIIAWQKGIELAVFIHYLKTIETLNFGSRFVVQR